MAGKLGWSARVPSCLRPPTLSRLTVTVAMLVPASGFSSVGRPLVGPGSTILIDERDASGRAAYAGNRETGLGGINSRTVAS